MPFSKYNNLPQYSLPFTIHLSQPQPLSTCFIVKEVVRRDVELHARFDVDVVGEGIRHTTTDHEQEAGVVDVQRPRRIELRVREAHAQLREGMHVLHDIDVGVEVVEVVLPVEGHGEEQEIVIEAKLKVDAGRPVVVDVVTRTKVEQEAVRVVVGVKAQPCFDGEVFEFDPVQLGVRSLGCNDGHQQDEHAFLHFESPSISVVSVAAAQSA